MSYDKVKALLAQGISRPTMFRVLIPNIGTKAQDQLTFMCKTARVPETSVSTVAVNGQHAMGVVREQPTRVTYANPFSISVIADRDYTVYDALRNWFETTATNANPFFVEVQTPLGNARSSSQNQRVGYYDELVRQITLEKLEPNQGPGTKEDEMILSPFTVTFNNAYIIRIGQLQFDTENRDSYIAFDVDFAYETYTYDRRDQFVKEGE